MFTVPQSRFTYCMSLIIIYFYVTWYFLWKIISDSNNTYSLQLVARKRKVHIISVKIIRNIFSEVYGDFGALYSSSRLFSYVQIMCSRLKTQTEYNLQKWVKLVYSTYCVPRNILTFTGFSSTVLLTCS